jgi:transposase
VNLRKSFDGLSNEVRAVLVRDPLSGHVFVFLNKRRNQVKLLVWTAGACATCGHAPRSVEAARQAAAPVAEPAAAALS